VGVGVGGKLTHSLAATELSEIAGVGQWSRTRWREWRGA